VTAVTVVVLMGVVTALGWYCARGLARRWRPARRVVDRLSPRTRALNRWVLGAPATFTYVAIFTASTIVQQSVPPRLIDVVTTLNSTNLRALSTRPVRVLVTSMLWVSDRGFGYAFYLAVFVTVVAWAEHRFGPARLIVCGLATHVIGSLLVAQVENHAIRTGSAPASLATTTDVGVSYVMVGGCAAAVVALRAPLRYAAGAVLLAAVLLPAVVTRTLWDLGHLLALSAAVPITLALKRVAPLRQDDVDERPAGAPVARWAGVAGPAEGPG
jgi:hypothetical protein